VVICLEQGADKLNLCMVRTGWDDPAAMICCVIDLRWTKTKQTPHVMATSRSACEVTAAIIYFRYQTCFLFAYYNSIHSCLECFDAVG